MSTTGNRYAPYFLLLLGAILLHGCQGAPTPDRPETADNNDLSAQEIFSEVIKQYQQAESYTDNGMLYLNYRLNDRMIQEPQPWSTQWSRDEGLSNRFFDVQIQYDGQRMSCFIFDIDSGNLDDQQWVTQTNDPSRIDNLFTDPIAQHFLCGFSEMPLDDSRQSLETCLASPILRLCTNSNTNPWLTPEAPLQRLADQTVDDNICYVIQLTSNNENFQFYVNQKTGIIEQLRLPLAYLDERVRSSDEIADVELFARFHDAQINIKHKPNTFVVEPKDQAKVVGQFISLPEPFPSDWIGRPLPDLGLLQPDGTPFSTDKLTGKTTAFFWFANELDSLKHYKRIADDGDVSTDLFYAIYSDAELKDPGTKSTEPSDSLQTIVGNSAEPKLLYDPQMKSSAQLKLTTVPAILVVGPDRILQYAQGIEDGDWDQRLVAAMKRIEAGEDLATEMRVEYDKYRQQYDQQVAAHDQSNLFESETPKNETSNGPSKFKLSRIWSSEGFSASGNLIAIGESLFIMDGFQTIWEVDGKGVRKPDPIILDLPNGKGVTRLRGLQLTDGNRWLAGFSMFGEIPYLFNEQWKDITPIVVGPDGVARWQNTPVSDCQISIDKTGVPRMFVAFADRKGLIEFKANEKPDSLFEAPVYAISAPEANVLLVQNTENKRVLLNRPQLNQTSTNGKTSQSFIGDVNLEYQSLAGSSKLSVAIGTNSEQQWRAVGLDPAGKIVWNRAVGPQIFDSDLESLALSNERQWIAIADNQHQIEIIDYRGNRVIRHQFNKPIRGLTWHQGRLAVSLGDTIELWQIQPIKGSVGSQ